MITINKNADDKIKIILYGTGKTSQPIMKKLCQISSIQVTAVADGNLLKEGQDFYGHKIIAPKDISNYSYDYLIIASIFKDEIKEQLKNIGVDINKILDNYIYFMQCHWIKEHYKAFYDKNDKLKQDNIDNNEKIIIYTAMFGEYDELHDPEYIDQNCDYICFTDNANLTSKVWKINLISDKYIDPNRAAKKYKIMPHEFFENYSWSIWIDANITIIGDMRKLLSESIGYGNIANLIHVDRDCIYDEADTCISMQKDNADVIQKQMDSYRMEGYPIRNGLICGSCIIRKHNEPEVVRLMARWWDEIQKKSRRDQLSFNYSAWKEEVFYDVMNIHTFINPYFITNKHLI